MLVKGYIGSKLGKGGFKLPYLFNLYKAEITTFSYDYELLMRCM